MKLFFAASFGFLLAWSAPLSAQAQHPSASFSASASCINEALLITNGATNADQYAWDFCADDFSNLKYAGSLAVVSGLNYGTAFKMVEDKGQWIGFALSWYTDKLLRFDFGNSPLNSPTVTNLGNPGGILSFPESIELVQQNGSWFAFITNIDIGAGITMLDFGTSLTNTPSIVNLGNFGAQDRIFDIQAVKQGADYFLVFAKVTTREIVCVNFRDSFYNSTSGFVYSNTISGPSFISSMDVIWNGASWKALLTSYLTNEIYQLNFGADLTNAPAKDASYPSIVANPNRVAILKQADEFFAVVSADVTGDIRIFNFHDLTSGSPATLPYTTITGILGFEPLRFNGTSMLMGVGTSTNLNQLIFESSCGANNTYVVAASPAGINYATSGAKKIELLVGNSVSKESDSNGATVTISSSTSPDIDFTSQNVCVNNAVSFSGVNQSGNIASSSWNFGDSGSAIGMSASHAYSSASTYPVTLTIMGSNGCQNRAKKNLQIFNLPQASFNLPVASPVCTNQNYLFTNTSSFDVGSNPTWQWTVNGSNVAVTQDLNYLIASTSAQTVKLIAAIPGCSSQSAQTIASVITGPSISFSSPVSGCVNSALSFTSTSSGATTSLNWTFGDGNSLPQQTTASNSYTSAGVYTVTLSSTNAAGCQNFTSKLIPVYSIPQPDFAIEAPPFSCANFPAQFDNNTSPLPDSNIKIWFWDFGDATTASDTSNQKNPTYSYPAAGNYIVILKATTNFGCIGTTQKGIVIFPSPQAAFVNSAACVNQSTQFTDASTGSVSSLQWTIQGTNVPGQNPKYIFKNPGSYLVTLTALSGNNCKSQITKNVVVPVVPALDFSTQAPCTRNETVFQELTAAGADPTASWNWNFGSSGGTGSPVSNTFSSAGGYAVTMNTTRQSGCVYSISKNVNIYDGPLASFAPSVLAGGAPLTVTFTNNSSNEDSVSWQFEDANNTQSIEVSPTFTYLQLGKYKPMLTAINRQLGCKDTVSMEINVVIPHLDLAMTNLSLAPDPGTNSSKVVVTILNSGNIPLTNPDVLIDLSGNATLKESITAVLQPGGSLQRTLSLDIIPESLSYICVAVAEPNDVNEGNDKQCLSATGNDVMLQPYPNPATDQIHFEWISSSAEDVVVVIYRSNGELALQRNFVNVLSGINQLDISTSSLATGLYLIQFSGAKTKKTFRFMVVN